MYMRFKDVMIKIKNSFLYTPLLFFGVGWFTLAILADCSYQDKYATEEESNTVLNYEYFVNYLHSGCYSVVGNNETKETAKYEYIEEYKTFLLSFEIVHEGKDLTRPTYNYLPYTEYVTFYNDSSWTLTFYDSGHAIINHWSKGLVFRNIYSHYVFNPDYFSSVIEIAQSSTQIID